MRWPIEKLPHLAVTLSDVSINVSELPFFMTFFVLQTTKLHKTTLEHGTWGNLNLCPQVTVTPNGTRINYLIPFKKRTESCGGCFVLVGVFVVLLFLHWSVPTQEPRNSGKPGLRLPQSQQKQRLGDLSGKNADGGRSVHFLKKKIHLPGTQVGRSQASLIDSRSANRVVLPFVLQAKWQEQEQCQNRMEGGCKLELQRDSKRMSFLQCPGDSAASLDCHIGRQVSFKVHKSPGTCPVSETKLTFEAV